MSDSSMNGGSTADEEIAEGVNLDLDTDEGALLDSSQKFNKTPTEKIEKGRTELFEKGSPFKFTKRSDIVGIDNVLMEIDPVVHWLQNSQEYAKFDARLEPGIIFEGEPGTGKTLVSRYIASASEALFVNVREFPIENQLFRAQDITDLFRRARKVYEETKQPVVLFWDEFESAGVERGGASPEQAMTTTQLLAELDGVNGKNQGVLLIACTNYLYGVDAALRRPGRMGIHIEFTAPDREGKKLLLEHYLGFYPRTDALDIDTLSYFFDSGAVAADIEEACVEAWRLAVRRDIESHGKAILPEINQEHLVNVFLKRLVGPPTAFVNLPMEDRARIALHESGHAIMALVYDIPLRLVTVQPGKKCLGRCITAEVREHVGTMDEWMSQMRVAIGSIVAERETGVPALVGSTGDVNSVNQIATKLVDNLYAGGQTGLFKPQAVAGIRASRSHNVTPNLAEHTIIASDQDVRLLLDQTNKEAQEVMRRVGSDALWEIANALNERVTLTGKQFREVFEAATDREPQSFRP